MYLILTPSASSFGESLIEKLCVGVVKPSVNWQQQHLKAVLLLVKYTDTVAVIISGVWWQGKQCKPQLFLQFYDKKLFY